MDKSKQSVTFEPEPEQLAFAEIYLDYNRKLTFEDTAKEVGVSRTTIWRWFKNKDFVSWLNSKKDELLNKSLMDRYRTAVRKARAGDFSFSKLLFEIQGEYIPRSESKVTNIYDGYENMTDEEIIEEFRKDLDRYRNSDKQTGMDKEVNQAKKD